MTRPTPAHRYLTVVPDGGAERTSPDMVTQTVRLEMPASIPPLAIGDVLIVASRTFIPDGDVLDPEPRAA